MLLSHLITSDITYEEVFIERSDRKSRNQHDDLIKAIDCLYEFKKILNGLHPSVLPIIECILKSDVV